MDDSQLVQIAEAVRERRDDAIGLQFAEDGASADVAVEFAAAQKLHYDIHMLCVSAAPQPT